MSSHVSVPQGRFDRVPPGPKGWPILGLIPDLIRDLLGTYRNASTYGDIVEVKMGTQKAYLINNPDMFKYVLQDNYKNYTKGKQMAAIRPLLGNGLFLSEGAFWFSQRRLMQPAFHRPALAALTDLMTSATAMVLEHWEQLPPTRSINMMQEVRQITQTVIVQAMFSTSIKRDETDAAGAALDFALQTLVERAIMPFSAPDWLPTRKNRKLKASMKILNDLVYRFIHERRAQVNQTGDGIDTTGDLLSMLMNARYEDTGTGMSDDQLRDEVMTMFLAGHETTATVLSWVFILLNQNPDVEARLIEEVDRVLEGRCPTFDDLALLPYTRMVIQETLRLYPSVWMTARQAINDDNIGGYHIPKDSMLMMAIYLLHTDPRHWDQPERFDPERFSDEKAAERNRFAYVPFGRGPRTCIGEHFAMMEASLVLAMIAQKYRPRMVPNQAVGVRPMGTLQPLRGPFMTIEKR